MAATEETVDRRPVWLLDVDGVLNARRPGWGAAPKQGYAVADGTAWKFRWADPVVGFVRETMLKGAAEVRWSTTWVPWTNSVEACFRLPVLPLAFSPHAADVWEAKMTAALAVVEAEGRPLVWTDDERVPTFGAMRERLLAAGVPVLLVAPDGRRGLQPEHVAEIAAFLTEHAPVPIPAP